MPGGFVQGVDQHHGGAVRLGEVICQGLEQQFVEQRVSLLIVPHDRFQRQPGEASFVLWKLGRELVGDGADHLGRVALLLAVDVAEVEGSDLAPFFANPGRDSTLACAGRTGDPEDFGRLRVLQPGVHFLEHPFPSGEVFQQLQDVCGERYGLQSVQQALLVALEIELVFLQCLEQAFITGLVEWFSFMNREALAHIQPLDAAGGQRRLLLHDHQRDDAQSESQGSGDFIQAVAIG